MAFASLVLACSPCVSLGGPISFANDSIEGAAIGLIPGNAAYTGGARIRISLLPTMESGGAGGAFNSTGILDAGGILSWRATQGQIVTAISGSFDTYIAPTPANTITDTITAHVVSEIKSVFYDDEDAEKDVVIRGSSSAALPAPNPPVFAGPGNGFANVVAVTLTNPFPQILIVDSDSLAVPGLNVGSSAVDASYFNPFGDALKSGMFYISPNSSITASIGISFPSSLDQDFFLALSGNLADGTLVNTPLLAWDETGGVFTLAGTFEAVPEPSTLILAAVGASSLLCFGSRRRNVTP
jgi:hypothetical protein